MQSKAYIVPDGSKSDKLNGKKWIVIRTAFSFQGIINGGDSIPKKSKIPTFTIIGTNKNSIKNEMSRIIDDVFNNILNLP